MTQVGREEGPSEVTGPILVHESLLHAEHPLHRPRHGRRQVGAGVAAGVFLLVPLLAFTLGARPQAFENRAVAPMPALDEGWGVLTGLPAWAGDHLPLRQQAVQAADDISEGVFGEAFPLDPGRGGLQQGPVAPVAPGLQHEAQAVGGAPLQDEETRRMAAAGYPAVIEGKDGWLFYGYDAFGACRPERVLTDTVARLQRLRSAVLASGRDFTLVVAPNKSSVMADELPEDFLGANCVRTASAALWTAVTDEIGGLDLRPALAEAARSTGAPTYFREDSHWNFDGALMMAVTLAAELDPGAPGPWTTVAGGTVSGVADLPPLVGTRGVNQAELRRLATDGDDDRTRPLEPLPVPVTDTNPVGPGVVDRDVALLGDSFVINAAPYLRAAFTEITVANVAARSVSIPDVAGVVADSDTVVIEVVERNLVAGSSQILSDPWLSELEAVLATHPR